MLVLVAGAALSTGAQAWAQNANLDQDRAHAAELLADASTRTSLLANNAEAGYDGMFNMADGTGNNRLNVGGTSQTRYNVSMRDDMGSDGEGTIGDNDFTSGFNQPTTRLRFWGNVWDKALSFKVQGNFGDSGDNSGFGLEDAWGKYAWEGTWVRWGQFKLPLIRESLVDNEYQLAMDRSVTSMFFDQGYSQGIEFGYEADAFRINGAFSDGLGTANTDFNSSSESDWAFTARAEFKAMGADWSRFDDLTSWRSAPDQALLIGGALHYQTGGETGYTNDVDGYVATVDVSFEGQGWNVMGAGYMSSFEVGGGEATDTFGVVIQGGIFVTDQVELFGRGDVTMFEEGASGGVDDDVYFVAAGMNYYVSPESHAVKLTAQVGYALDDTSGLGFGAEGSGSTRNGFLGDSEGGEIAVQVQMQVVF